MFSQRQIQEFKEAFGIMDCDKNGLLSEDDLVSAFAAVANPSPQEKPATCSQNPPDQLTSHKWSHFSPKRWLEVPMMTTPSSNLLMHSKSTAKLMQKCSSIHS